MTAHNSPGPKPELVIVREFNAPKQVVFEAFSDASALAEWWGPVEFPTTVIKLDFRPHGIFHYKMESPGQSMWGKFVYGQIKPPDLLEFTNSFSDEQGNVVRAPFSAEWPLEIFNRLTFTEKNGVTTIVLTGYPVNATDRENEMFMSLQTNVQSGFAGTFNQLEAYINAQMNLRKQLKTTNMARVSTYLNFPGNTEEAFTFYKSVFGSEFHGDGIQRFGDIPQSTDTPALPDEMKNLVLHIELPILGGHILMGTDATESMGFQVIFGNNSHINLEPETRGETKRLYEELSAGGKVTMELQDMFWGAYYGSCTDKFGVQWMFNCTEKA